MRQIIREPLLHFLLAGFLVFVYYRYWPSNSKDDRTIVIDRKSMLDYVQFQSRAFNEDIFGPGIDQLDEVEKQRLVNQYVRDEVLYREAVRLGLDQHDEIIRRRIIQKMEFILDDMKESELYIDEDSLSVYFDLNRHRYTRDARYTFAHIFFDNDGTDLSAYDRAISFMEEPGHTNLSAAESLKYGDRFLYHRNYADKSRSFIESQFGASFALQLESLMAEAETWQGPVASDHGQHLILLKENKAESIPPFDEIKEVVSSDYIWDVKRRKQKKHILDLIKEYDIRVHW